MDAFQKNGKLGESTLCQKFDYCRRMIHDQLSPFCRDMPKGVTLLALKCRFLHLKGSTDTLRCFQKYLPKKFKKKLNFFFHRVFFTFFSSIFEKIPKYS